MYIHKIIGIYLTYTMYIPFKFFGYTVQNSLKSMVYAWYMSCMYKKNTWIYFAYTMYISFKFSGYTVQNSLIYMVYA